MNLEDWDGVELWSKNGGTAGFQSQVFLVREPAVTVVLLANANDIEGMRTLGEAVLGEVLP